MNMKDKIDCPCMEDVTFEDCVDCCEYWECFNENGKLN